MSSLVMADRLARMVSSYHRAEHAINEVVHWSTPGELAPYPLRSQAVDRLFQRQVTQGRDESLRDRNLGHEGASTDQQRFAVGQFVLANGYDLNLREEFAND